MQLLLFQAVAFQMHSKPTCGTPVARNMLQNRSKKGGLTMQISSLFSGYSDPTSLTKILDPSTSTDTKKVEKTGEPSATTQVSAEVVQGIVSRYDLTNITPQQFSEMLQSLREAGALTDQQFQDLSMIRMDLDAQGVTSDESVNLLDLYRDRLEQLQKQFDDAQDGLAQGSPQPESLESVTRWLTWLEKIATLQSSPELMGVNAVV
jgi:hypothetical protein